MNLDTEAFKPPSDHGNIKLKCMVNDILNAMFINCFQSLFYTGLPEQFHLGKGMNLDRPESHFDSQSSHTYIFIVYLLTPL